MTEPVFFAALFALLYFTVRFRDTRGWGALAGRRACRARRNADALRSLVSAAVRRRFTSVSARAESAGPRATRLLPRRRRRARCSGWRTIAGITATRSISTAAPIRRSRSRAKSTYPGRGDWRVAANISSPPDKLVVGLAGADHRSRGRARIALLRRVFWPLLLLALPPLFYVWSIHSSGTPDLRPGALAAHLLQHALRAGLPAADRAGAAALVRIRQSDSADCRHRSRLHRSLAVSDSSHAALRSPGRNRRQLARPPPMDLASRRISCAPPPGPHETFFTSFGDLTADLPHARHSAARYPDRRQRCGVGRRRRPPRPVSPRRLGRRDRRRRRADHHR